MIQPNIDMVRAAERWSKAFFSWHLDPSGCSAMSREPPSPPHNQTPEGFVTTNPLGTVKANP